MPLALSRHKEMPWSGGRRWSRTREGQYRPWRALAISYPAEPGRSRPRVAMTTTPTAAPKGSLHHGRAVQERGQRERWAGRPRSPRAFRDLTEVTLLAVVVALFAEIGLDVAVAAVGQGSQEVALDRASGGSVGGPAVAIAVITELRDMLVDGPRSLGRELRPSPAASPCRVLDQGNDTRGDDRRPYTRYT